MARKIKAKKVPLSALDKFIYVMIGLSGFVFLLAIMIIFGGTIPDAVAFSDKSIVARYGLTGLGCCIPMALFMSLTLTIVAYEGWKDEQPIVGNKKFKPKFNQPVLKTFPLFSRDFRENLTERQKKSIKKLVLLLSLLFLICGIVLLLGIYPRTVLDNENTFKTYNSFNQVTHETELNEAEEAIINITSSGGRKGTPHWGIEMKFVFEEKTYHVALGSFGDMEREEVLLYMLSLKEPFKDGRYEITNIDRMEKLVNDKDFSNSELKLVYELFDYTP